MLEKAFFLVRSVAQSLHKKSNHRTLQASNSAQKTGSYAVAQCPKKANTPYTSWKGKPRCFSAPQRRTGMCATEYMAIGSDFSAPSLGLADGNLVGTVVSPTICLDVVSDCGAGAVKHMREAATLDPEGKNTGKS